MLKVFLEWKIRLWYLRSRSIDPPYYIASELQYTANKKEMFATTDSDTKWFVALISFHISKNNQ
jgi:hypothetical protein